MTTQPRLKTLTAIPLIALLAACGGDAADPAQEAAPVGDAPPEITQRQDNFEAIGDSFKLIREQLESGNPDFAAMEAAAVDINTRAQQIGDYFPAGTSVEDGFDTEALPTIWSNPEGFEAAQARLVEESATMVTLVQGGDAAAVGGHVRQLGGTCGNCHDDFRVDDD